MLLPLILFAVAREWKPTFLYQAGLLVRTANIEKQDSPK